MSYKEADIMHDNGKYWVLKDKQRKAYFVMVTGVCVSESDSAYSLDDDGLSIAVARCNYLAKRNTK
jgi:hypothetical protein